MLNKHFQEFIELLEKKKVRYLLVGGYAVGYHVFPWYTGDLDIFIAISESNSDAILQVFNGIDGVTFDECYRGKEFFETGGINVPFIGYAELMKNKEASPRSKDKIDLEELCKLKPESGK